MDCCKTRDKERGRGGFRALLHATKDHPHTFPLFFGPPHKTKSSVIEAPIRIRPQTLLKRIR